MNERHEFVDTVASLPVIFPVQAAVTVYLAVLLLVLIVSGLHILHTGVMWTLADWLINYQGGFVRRGLLGEIAFRIGYAAHVPFLAVVLLFGVAAYAALFFLVWRLTRSLHWNYWYLLLLFSPVTLQFPIVSTSSFHKEILLFAAFAGLLYLLHLKVRDGILVAYMSMTGTACVLTHESLVLYAPYIVSLLYIFLRDIRRLLRLFWFPLVCCQIAFIAAALHPGNHATFEKICASLDGNTPLLCQGSIKYLTYTPAGAHADVLETMFHFHYWTFYPYLTILGSLPFIGCYFHLCLHGLPRDIQRVLLLSTALSILLSIPLFIFATDWGRWIHMHFMMLFMLLIAAELLYGDRADPQTEKRKWNQRSALATLSLVVYSTCWSLPGYSSFPKGGYISTVKRIAVRAKYKQIF